MRRAVTPIANRISITGHSFRTQSQSHMQSLQPSADMTHTYRDRVRFWCAFTRVSGLADSAAPLDQR